LKKRHIDKVIEMLDSYKNVTLIKFFTFNR